VPHCPLQGNVCQHFSDADYEEDSCFICLLSAAESKPESGQLIRPCKCSTRVHSVCLAKWQLSQASKRCGGRKERALRRALLRAPLAVLQLELQMAAAYELLGGQDNVVKARLTAQTFPFSCFKALSSAFTTLSWP
jgi:hypothetical protein